MSKSNGFESINVRMKELEEKAPYASEYDDYQDESDEVYGDQGNALPFSKGFHLVGQLVAAFNPYDLDAMDESIPLTKWALDQLLGYVSSAQDYAHYYGEFLKAQKIRKGDDRDDRIKRQMDWKSHMESFMSTKYSESLQCVQDFKRRLDSRYRPIRIPDDAFTAEQQALYQRPSPSSYQQSPPSTYQQPPPPTYQQPSTSYQQAPYLQPPPSTHQQPPGPYGQSPSTYGQVPPSYAQASPTYGQTPTAYNQQPPATYGQAPPSYGQAPPGYTANGSTSRGAVERLTRGIKGLFKSNQNP